MTAPTTPTTTEGLHVLDEARHRRSFAVISHPDAGKSTLTEALALHARAITQAGAVHGKGNRRGTVSDWMTIEQDRGISITSAALQLNYRDCVLNLVDTPGHADFSEDTYRVLAAVDCAIMLLDAAKGLEPQTMKLFDVCKTRGIPLITMINKWDRPGLDALALMDEVETRTGLKPTPLNWPVGVSGHFQGLLDRESGDFTPFVPAEPGRLAPDNPVSAQEAEKTEGEAWSTAVDESDLMGASDADHDQEAFLAGRTTPVLFGSAVSNFGVKALLDAIIDLAPSPLPRPDVDGTPREIDAPFSAFVFKVQAGMDASHRDRMAFVRICSGVFERGMVVTHGATGRPFATKYAQRVFGRDRESVDEAFPGDVVGLVNASALRVGDSLYVDKPVVYPAMPSFAPEFFVVCRAADSSKYKQFRKGIEQLDQEGVVQVLRSDLRGDQAPVLAAVGLLQFEVAEHRMGADFSAPVKLERLDYTLARATSPAWVPTLAAYRGVEVLERSDGELLALFPDRWRLQSLMRDHPEADLRTLTASI